MKVEVSEHLDNSQIQFSQIHKMNSGRINYRECPGQTKMLWSQSFNYTDIIYKSVNQLDGEPQEEIS